MRCVRHWENARLPCWANSRHVALLQPVIIKPLSKERLIHNFGLIMKAPLERVVGKAARFNAQAMHGPDLGEALPKCAQRMLKRDASL